MLMPLIIAIVVVITVWFAIILRGGNHDKDDHMCVEKCDRKNCDLCIDLEQCKPNYKH